MAARPNYYYGPEYDPLYSPRHPYPSPAQAIPQHLQSTLPTHYGRRYQTATAQPSPGPVQGGVEQKYKPRNPFSLELRPLNVPRLPLQLFYLCCLFQLPSLYFSRITFVFLESGMTESQIKQMAVDTSDPEVTRAKSRRGARDRTPNSDPNSKLKKTWEGLVKSLIDEWEVMNVVFTILLPYVSQIDRGYEIAEHFLAVQRSQFYRCRVLQPSP